MARQLAGVLLLGVALVSLSCTPAIVPQRGIMIDIASSPERCGDGREEVAVAIGHGSVKLNSEPAGSLSEVARTLGELMSLRAEKVIFVKAESDARWGEFVEMVDRLWPEVNVISIVTPRVEVLARQRGCISPSCRDCKKFGGLGSSGRQQ